MSAGSAGGAGVVVAFTGGAACSDGGADVVTVGAGGGTGIGASVGNAPDLVAVAAA